MRSAWKAEQVTVNRVPSTATDLLKLSQYVLLLNCSDVPSKTGCHTLLPPPPQKHTLISCVYTWLAQARATTDSWTDAHLPWRPLPAPPFATGCAACWGSCNVLIGQLMDCGAHPAPGALSLGVKRPGRTADFSRPSGTEGKNVWS
jgi:hypothetical protein